MQPTNQPANAGTGNSYEILHQGRPSQRAKAPIKQTQKAASQQPPAASLADRLVQLDATLLKIAKSDQPAIVVRNSFRRVAIEFTRAIGACHLTSDEEGQWGVANQHATGRIPDAVAMREKVLARCDELFAARTISTLPLDQPEQAVAVIAPVPIRMAGMQPEVFLLVARKAADAAAAVAALDRVVGALELWSRTQSGNEAQWQLDALASITELVTEIESCDTVKQAADEMTNGIVRHWSCGSSALALTKKGKLQVASISGSQKLDRSSGTHLGYHQALKESVMRNQSGVYPAVDDENAHLLLAHQDLASTLNADAIYSHPLVDADDKVIGAWLLTGDQAMLQSPAMARYMETACPKVTSGIGLLKRAELTRMKRMTNFVRRKTSWFTQAMLVCGVVALALLMALPVTYRVRCNGTVEPVSRRFAVAPFDGLVVSGFVEPGDYVKQDQVLAEIDGRSIRWELSGVTAERRQSLRQREMELAEGNIPETFLAELENERLTSQERILKFKRDHLEIRSPTDGVVLSGSLERSVAASVTTGETLFEIAPLTPMKIEVSLPADESSRVHIGQDVKVWIEGQEETPITGQITRIHPRSETRDAKNIFVAEVEYGNEDERLRPGMKGSVRIDCEQQPLAWCLFHKPINYLSSRLTWW